MPRASFVVLLLVLFSCSEDGGVSKRDPDASGGAGGGGGLAAGGAPASGAGGGTSGGATGSGGGSSTGGAPGGGGAPPPDGGTDGPTTADASAGSGGASAADASLDVAASGGASSGGASSGGASSGGASSGGASSGGASSGGASSGGASSGGASSGGASSVDASADAPSVPEWGLEARTPNGGCVAPARPVPAGLALERAFTSLAFNGAVGLVQIPGDGSHWYVVLRSGIVRRFANQQAASSSTVVMDISTRVDDGPGEAGLLGLAFDPRFAETRAVYVSYTADGGSTGLRSRLSRFKSNDGGVTIDPASEEILLELEQPFDNHNGGDLAFSVDGYLYWSLGDGGSGGDPGNRAQDTSSLFGKILRLDISAGTGPYQIPPTNPYASGGGRPEIFALGLRNPWRISVDRSTGLLWVGDVGQDRWEEIDVVTLGGNYGWRFREGAHCFNPGTNCPTVGLIDPVTEYANSGADACVIGGHVYRGTRLPDLAGTYLFGDCGSGLVRSYSSSGQTQILGNAGGGISAFGQGIDGEVYTLRYSGQIYRITDSGGGTSSLPATLSATGCTAPGDATVLAPGVIPYDLNSPLWSDGAAKERWMAVPDGATISIAGDGDFDLPVGSVLGKTFSLAGKRVETRLFVRHQDGDWAGYAYEWNDSDTEANLVSGAVTKTVAGQDWTIPSRTDCLFCHSVPAGRTLGLEVGQLNRDFAYPNGATGNQLSNLEHAGYLSAPLPGPAASLTRYPVPASPGAVEPRARAYLHANCSMCHRPGGPGLGDMDLRWVTPLAGTGTCDVAPSNGDLGVTGARFIAPGSPSTSVVSLRMHTLGVSRMPPLASGMVDPTGTAVIDQFIQALPACP